MNTLSDIWNKIQKLFIASAQLLLKPTHLKQNLSRLVTSGFKFQPKHKHIDPKTQKFLWRVDPAVNTYLFGGGVPLQHRQIQPLWRKTETRTCYRMVHESSSFMLASLSHRAYYLHETQLNLTGSIIVQLFESVCCKKKEKILQDDIISA